MNWRSLRDTLLTGINTALGEPVPKPGTTEAPLSDFNFAPA